MPDLSPLVAGDREELHEYLRQPPGIHLYLASRLESEDAGEGLVYRESGRIQGFAWFGVGRNLVVAGDAPPFLGALAEEAFLRESRWLMLVGPWDATSDLLERYLARTSRQPRLDRSQGLYLQFPGDPPDLSEPRLQPAVEEDLDELVPLAARMSAEDFDVDPWRIDQQQVRRSLTAKMRGGRCWLFRMDGRVAFKVDLAVRGPLGGQVEGVYTTEDLRGHGIASRCMAEFGRRLLAELPYICLHVSSVNTPAIRAYENAGYRRTGELRLAIFNPY